VTDINNPNQGTKGQGGFSQKKASHGNPTLILGPGKGTLTKLHLREIRKKDAHGRPGLKIKEKPRKSGVLESRISPRKTQLKKTGSQKKSSYGLGPIVLMTATNSLDNKAVQDLVGEGATEHGAQLNFVLEGGRSGGKSPLFANSFFCLDSGSNECSILWGKGKEKETSGIKTMEEENWGLVRGGKKRANQPL